jgi:hypothetical protein
MRSKLGFVLYVPSLREDTARSGSTRCMFSYGSDDVAVCDWNSAANGLARTEGAILSGASQYLIHSCPFLVLRAFSKSLARLQPLPWASL